jgi:predicted glutamine amidotransferase
MFAYTGTSRKDLSALYRSLKKAAKHDEMLVWEKEENKKQHKDGWGCVIFAEGELFHYRTHRAIFEDKDLELPNFSGKAYAIFHARKASDADLKASPIFSHPFVAETGHELLFLAHNGGMEDQKAVPENMVDSELALRMIAERGGLEPALDGLEAMKWTALNLLLLKIDRSTHQAKIECLNRWYADGADKAAYYKLYHKALSGGKAVFSSTLNKKLHGEECGNGVFDL